MADAGNINVVLSVNKASFSAAMADAQNQLDKFAGKAKSAGGHTVSSMQAASASIRLLENPLGNNMRAIERLISQSKVLSSVMQAAFPLVGATAIGSMIAKLGKDVVDFVQKLNAMPKAIEQGFNQLGLSARTTNDELDLTNAKLEQEINKLEDKPTNNLKTALFESRVEADKLASSLSSDAKAVTELLTQNKIGLLGSLIGKAPTSSVSSSVESYMNDLQALGNSLSVAAQKPGNDAQVADLKKQISDKQNSGLSWAKTKLFLTDNPQYATQDDDIMGGDNASNRAILLGFQGTLLNQQHHQAAEDTNKSLTGQKEADEEKKEANRQSLEAQKKAAAEQLAQWEEQNSDWKAVQDRSLLEDAAWWKQKLQTLTTGSLNYRTISRKVNADIIADARQYAETISKYTTEYLTEFHATSGLSAADTRQIQDSGKAAAEYITALRTSIELNRENAEAIAASSIQMGLATGQMTKLDAAQATANLHTQQYNATLQALRDSKDFVQSNNALTDLQKQAQTAQLDNQITALKGQRTIQIQQDHQETNPAGSLASVGFKGALDDFVTASRDAATQMRKLTTGTLNSINQELLKGMTGQRTDWKGAGAGIFRNVASTGLQKAEGSLLSGLGFGAKADGSRSNPLYVRMADSIKSAASSLTSGLGSGAKGLFGSIIGALPHFANGGPMSANMLSVVGERGPELFSPGTSGSIIPNHQISSGSSNGGNAFYSVSVANGVTPEQMAMHVQSALKDFHPTVVRIAHSAMQQHQQRTPQFRR